MSPSKQLPDLPLFPRVVTPLSVGEMELEGT